MTKPKHPYQHMKCDNAPVGKHEAGLLPLVPEEPLGDKSARPSAEKLHQMQCLFADPAAVFAGLFLVPAVGEKSNQAGESVYAEDGGCAKSHWQTTLQKEPRNFISGAL